MQERIRQRLLALAQRDAETRQRLAADLAELIDEHGWPTSAMAGEDGAEAAWLIAQHAIGLPAFQRRCLTLLEEAAAAGEIPPWQPAYLLDRICIFEGKPQLYGTGFDWDEQGLMSPRPIADPSGVDERRAAVGLPPLAEATARHRRQSADEPKPKDHAERQRNMAEWARSVGGR